MMIKLCSCFASFHLALPCFGFCRLPSPLLDLKS